MTFLLTHIIRKHIIPSQLYGLRLKLTVLLLLHDIRSSNDTPVII